MPRLILLLPLLIAASMACTQPDATDHTLPSGTPGFEQILKTYETLESATGGFYAPSTEPRMSTERLEPATAAAIEKHDSHLAAHQAAIDELCGALLDATRYNSEAIKLPDQYWANNGAALGSFPAAIRPAVMNPRDTFRLLRDDAHRLSSPGTADHRRAAQRVAAIFTLTAIETANPTPSGRMLDSAYLHGAIDTARATLLGSRAAREETDFAKLLRLTERFDSDDPLGLTSIPSDDRNTIRPGVIDRIRVRSAAALAGFRAELGVLAEE